MLGKALYNAGLFLFVLKKDRMNERDSAVVGIRGNVYNWLAYGTVGNSVCRMWKSCSCFSMCCERSYPRWNSQLCIFPQCLLYTLETIWLDAYNYIDKVKGEKVKSC